jgi:hypothetical protein
MNEKIMALMMGPLGGTEVMSILRGTPRTLWKTEVMNILRGTPRHELC